MSKRRPPAVLLLSGGLDSTTLLAHAVREGFDVHALSFAYGQRHANELAAARRVAERYGAVEHRVSHIDLGLFGGSALTDESLDVPMDRDAADMSEGVPVTYVPARNTIFLAHALAYAEVVNASDIFIGVNSVDYSGYPDCRPQFIEAFQAMALRIRAPLMALSKAEIVRMGLDLGVDYALTSSCYAPSPSGAACGHCDACTLRLRGFAEAGVADPASYVGGDAERSVGTPSSLPSGS